MLGYVKLKTQNQELYETDFLSKLQQRDTWFSKIQYWVCYIFLEGIVWLKYVSNSITVKQIYHAYLFIFPFHINQHGANRKIKKCIKKMQRLMQKYRTDTLVLSEELKDYYQTKELGTQTERKVHILNGGKGLMPYLLEEILEYITKKQGTTLQLEDLYCCIKEQKNVSIENIAYLANYFRTINIITPNIRGFQKLADRIEEKQECIITVTNNKKKSLNKAKLIINFDFSEQELTKYSIYRRAIMISMQEEQNCTIASFQGVQVNNVAIDTSKETKELFQKYHLLGNCSLEELYESLLNERQGFSKVKQQMQKDQVRVIKLYGRKGKIEDKEYTEIA